jgi:hypothetical protein
MKAVYLYVYKDPSWARRSQHAPHALHLGEVIRKTLRVFKFQNETVFQLKDDGEWQEVHDNEE